MRELKTLRGLKRKVYVDMFEGWQSCKVIKQNNVVDRATVVTGRGTQLNRICRFVKSEEDENIVNDGCIYFWKDK